MNIGKAMLVTLVVWLLAAGLGLALSTEAGDVAGINSVILIFGAAFAIQWIAFIPAYLTQSERFFDLTGSLTYMAVSVAGLVLLESPGPVQWLVAALVVIWAGRLGTFLFTRILRDGKDGRFDEIKPNPLRFFNVWNIQGLWVTVTASTALAVLSSAEAISWSLFTWVGLTLWLVGFAIEAIADAQKSRFKANPDNRGKFIDEGLWRRSRHPNYFGEIMLWTGLAIIALPALQGWQYVALISPVFVVLLLTRVSGIPMLEKRADERWGEQADYQAYKHRTPVLIPKLSSTANDQAIQVSDGQ